MAYISDTADSLAFKLAAVQLVHSVAEVGRGLILNETTTKVSKVYGRGYKHLPSTIAIAADFGIDDVKSGLAGKVLQILESSVSPCFQKAMIQTESMQEFHLGNRID